MENDPERIQADEQPAAVHAGRAPSIYYGDEIGMGDNSFLVIATASALRCNGVLIEKRGFSRADPQQLYLPPIMDPIYGYESVNVEARRANRSSLLNWMKRMLQVRKGSQAFDSGL